MEGNVKRYVCTYEDCSASFGKPSRLEQHIRVHTGERPFKCDQCSHSYTRVFHLKRHITTAHEQIATPIFLCPVDGCGAQFVSEQKQRLHHQNIHSPNRLKCDSCSKTFKKNQQLKIHQYQHTGILTYQCDYEGCEKRFLMPSQLKAHQKTHKGYSCDSVGCSETFAYWSLLRKHKAEAHPKTYSCKTCDKIFKRPHLLKTHMAIHEPEREVFHCTYEKCTRWYYSGNSLKMHVDRYHNPGRYKCEFEGCEKVFVWKGSLMSHVASHTAGPKERKVSDRPRKPRSDKGKPKKALAAILSGCPLTDEENRRIMRSLD